MVLALSALRAALASAREKSADKAYRVTRRADYYRRVAQIFLDMQLTAARLSSETSSAVRDAAWEVVHQRNAQRVLNIALQLSGYFVKAGQILSTRADFVPAAWISALRQLQDDVPALSGRVARSLVEREIAVACNASFAASRREGTGAEAIPIVCRVFGENAGSISADQVFTDVDWDRPIGSASLASVYAGTLREDRIAVAGDGSTAGKRRRNGKTGSGRRVAIKVQNPRAASLVTGDVDSLVTVGKLLEKTSLPIKLTSFLQEVRKQVILELDFTREAGVMIAAKRNLKSIERVAVPSCVPSLTTPRMLVMEFLPGRNLNDIKAESKGVPEWKRRAFGTEFLNLVSASMGTMIFETGLMHADLHPGNTLVSFVKRGHLLGRALPPQLSLGLIDWGQSCQLSRQTQTRFARLIVELSQPHPRDSSIATALRATGLRFERMGSEEEVFLARAARLVFSSEVVDGAAFRLFGSDSIFSDNGVLEIPADLVFLIRTIQIQRGIASALGVDDFSLASRWRPAAVEYLRRGAPAPGYF
jgi:predicted unusual protein kinase regulating ubiquinone biosynthesis (AarF/ABC1/UbiB family)